MQLDIIKPQVEIFPTMDKETIMKLLEKAGRVCYKSEDYIKEGSADRFIRGIISRGHESVIEHISITARVTTDRGVTHQIVRHRIASYSQESQRYCNYSKGKFGQEITVIKPCFWELGDPQYQVWVEAMNKAAESYFQLIDLGATPEEARTVLPNSTKTELVMTMNLREWRHFLKIRTDKAAHPQIREVADMLLNELKAFLPIVFGDIPNVNEVPDEVSY